MKKILIFGSGDHARVILSEIIKHGDYQIIGFVDEDKKPGTSIETFRSINYKVVGKISNLSSIIDTDTYGIIGVGFNYLRKQMSYSISEKYPTLKWATIVSKDSIINGNVNLGQGCIIHSGCIINNGAKIGDHCIINTKSLIDHDNIFSDYVSTGPGVTTAGNVRVGECSHIGIQSVVNQNISIGDNSVIGSKSLCTRDCDSLSIYYGSPVKKIRSREQDEPYL